MDIRQYEPLFGAWHVVRQIGAGSFGTVYEISRTEFGQTYRSALKVISIPSSRAEARAILEDVVDAQSVSTFFASMVESFLQELVLMNQLKGNSHIVSYEDHEVIEKDSELSWDILIRMELLTPLNDYIQGRELSLPEIVKLGEDICQALELCQMHQIIHRDVKPENIFVSDNGDFKLGDFGIARTAERANRSMSQKGTYHYMAPEVFRSGRYDATVDLYALGIVLYRMLNHNRAPFLPDYPQQITQQDREDALAKRLSGERMAPPCQAPEPLAQIILKACAYQPKNRYATANQMRKELAQYRQRYLESSQPKASKPSRSVQNKQEHNNQPCASKPMEAQDAALAQAVQEHKSSAAPKEKSSRRFDKQFRKQLLRCLALCASLAVLCGVVELGRSLAVLLHSGTEQVALMTQRDQVWREAYGLAAQSLESDPALAKEQLDIAIETDPTRSAAYILRGDAWLAMGESEEHYQAALADYKTAVDLEPTQAHNQKLSDAREARDLWEKWNEAYTKGCGLLEEDAAAAVEKFTAAIGLDPTRDAAYLQRAAAYEQLGKTTEALRDYRTAAGKRPTAAAYLGVVDLSLYSAAWDDAIEALETGIQTVDLAERTVLEKRLAAMENAEIYNRAGEVCVTQSFYENGQLEERIFINPRKNSKVTFAYDGDGKQIKHIVQGYDEFGHEISFASYDVQGSILEYYEKDYSRDGSLLCTYREYDEECQLRRSEDYWYDDSKELSATITDEYDSQGNVVKSWCDDLETGESTVTTYTYNAQGQCTQEYYISNLYSSQTWIKEYNDAGSLLKETVYYGEELSWIYDYTYDSQQRLIRKTMETADGEFWGADEYSYDSLGDLEKELHYSSNMELVSYEIHTYEADENGGRQFLGEKIWHYNGDGTLLYYECLEEDPSDPANSYRFNHYNPDGTPHNLLS